MADLGGPAGGRGRGQEVAVVTIGAGDGLPGALEVVDRAERLVGAFIDAGGLDVTV